MKVFKDTHVKFQTERVDDVCMLRNSKVIVGGLQLSSASRAKVVEQLETMMFLSSYVEFYLKCRLRLGVQHDSLDRYFYGKANFHKSCMD